MNVIPFDKHELTNTQYNCPVYLPPPLASLNGGLYTGEPFDDNDTYKNYPNKADSVFLHSVALKSANPPPSAVNQYPDSFRPGNNIPDSKLIGLKQYDNLHSIICTNNSPPIMKKNVNASLSSDLKNNFYSFHDIL
jgi:hypothetical protein|uniref:Uncharacterized protein n=1 Tax=viral metagenome TaxID=1070528 RepID=A0A6C0BRD6_9ZZZZ